MRFKRFISKNSKRKLGDRKGFFIFSLDWVGKIECYIVSILWRPRFPHSTYQQFSYEKPDFFSFSYFSRQNSLSKHTVGKLIICVPIITKLKESKTCIGRKYLSGKLQRMINFLLIPFLMLADIEASKYTY